MSKLSFRARALDATKFMPIYQKHELSDLQDYSILNRAVPQMPSGMEKEEESEHHLQRAISAQQVYGDAQVMVIPVPEAEMAVARYNNLYIKSFRMPKHLVRNYAQGLSTILEQEKPDYDMDSEDEQWLKEMNKPNGLMISFDQFEEMVDRLEKSCGNQLVTLQEAKFLLKEDNNLIRTVHDYWMKKRLKKKNPLLFQICQEKRDGSSGNDGYVAFRRRTEKMQTRKNRKNDEWSYEKMLKLRRELSLAVTILQMVKSREKNKKELLRLTVEVFEKRYGMSDWDGKCLRTVKRELCTQRAATRMHVHAPNSSGYRNRHHTSSLSAKNKIATLAPRLISRGEITREIPPKKLKKKKSRQSGNVSLPSFNRRSQISKIYGPSALSSFSNKVATPSLQLPSLTNAETTPSMVSSDRLSNQKVVDTMNQYEFPPSDEDIPSPVANDTSDSFDSKKLPDGDFTFRRKPGCVYYAPRDDLVGEWPLMTEPKFRYSLTSLSDPDKCVGFTRRRVGRGGRVIFDRGYHPYNKDVENIDFGSERDYLPPKPHLDKLLKEINQSRWRHYRPTTNPSHVAGLLHVKDNDNLLHSNSSKQSFDLGQDVADLKKVVDLKLAPNKTIGKKSRRSPAKRSHKRLYKASSVGLDKSSVAFAMSALVTTMSPTTATTTSRNSQSATSGSRNAAVANPREPNHLTKQKCMTYGGSMTFPSTVTDSKSGFSSVDTSNNRQRLHYAALPVATNLQKTCGQRTTVLPATMTVTMSRARGGTHTTGVPAVLRICNPGVVEGTVLYSQHQPSSFKIDDRSQTKKPVPHDITLAGIPGTGTVVPARKTLPGQRMSRGAVNLSFALPAMLATINNESIGRGTMSTSNTPKSLQTPIDNSKHTATSLKANLEKARTINLNLGSFTTTQTQPCIQPRYPAALQKLSNGRIALAGNMLKVGGGPVFSVDIPPTAKSVTTAGTSATTLICEKALVANDGNIALTKIGDKNRIRTKLNEVSHPQSKLKSSATGNFALKSMQGVPCLDEVTPVNHTVQVNIQSSHDSVESGVTTNVLSSLPVIRPNNRTVKSSKTSCPMEVT